MQATVLFISLSLLAATTHGSNSPKCSKVIFTVDAKGTNSVFGNPANPGNSEQIVAAVDGFLNGNTTFGPIRDTEARGTFDIAAVYCQPNSVSLNENAKTLQLLVHGATYNSTIWSGLGLDDRYSWVKQALAYGYPTLSIDRLGHGESTHADPLSVVQFGLQVDVIHQLISQLRDKNCRKAVPTYDRVIYVGHSYGSFLGTSLSRQHPLDVDAMVLTGYSANLEVPVPIVLNDFNSAKLAPGHLDMNQKLPLGYLRGTNETGRTTAFYGKPGSFDPSVAKFDFTTADTVTAGELLSQAGGFSPSPYQGPVLIATGDSDIIFCNEAFGSCSNSLLQTRVLFPDATPFDVYVAQNSGHCLTLGFNAQATFLKAQQWISTLH
jgi:pimeloyl-ACP methyl ester carboxylesterase